MLVSTFLQAKFVILVDQTASKMLKSEHTKQTAIQKSKISIIIFVK